MSNESNTIQRDSMQSTGEILSNLVTFEIFIEN